MMNAFYMQAIKLELNIVIEDIAIKNSFLSPVTGP